MNHLVILILTGILAVWFLFCLTALLRVPSAGNTNHTSGPITNKRKQTRKQAALSSQIQLNPAAETDFQ